MNDFNLNAKQTLETVTKQVNTANYRARNVGLADTFTVEQWLTILNYWNWRCAVCGLATRDLSPDHWLPLSHEACPGSTYDNIIALCEGCNSSKNRTEPVLWLTNRLGADKANETIDKIRKSFQELTTVGHPYNTTIPEKVWLAPSDPSPDQYARLILSFDLTIPGEAYIWQYHTENIGMNGDQMRAYIKNLLWLACSIEIAPIYKDWKPQ